MMRAMRVGILAAELAALFFFQIPHVLADNAFRADPCDVDPQNCLIPLPQSIQVNPGGKLGDAEIGSYTDPGLFVSAHLSVPMPEFLPLPNADLNSSILSSFLPLGMRFQAPSDVSCGVQALGMAMEGVAAPAPSSPAILEFLQSSGMMYDFGTGVEELSYAAIHYGYAHSSAFHGWSMGELKSEILAGRPVVVALGSNGPTLPGHFVTLTGFSPDDSLVAYNDPTVGPRVVTSSEFSQLWKLQGNSGVVVRKAVRAESATDLAPAAAGAAALMASIALAPLGAKRKGIGGHLTAQTGVSASPPSTIPMGYRWISKQVPIFETRSVQDGWNLELKPRKVSKWRQVGWNETQVPVYRNVTIHDGWENYSERESYWTTERYVRYHRTVRKPRYRYIRGRRRFAGYSYSRQPVYGYRRLRKTRTVQKRRPKWKTVKEFSHWFTKKEPKYGWVQEQDGWEEIRTPRYVEKKVQVGTKTKWELQIDPRFDIVTPNSNPLPGDIPLSTAELAAPAWLAGGSRPPWLASQFWQALPQDDQLHVIQAETASFQKWLAAIEAADRSGSASSDEWLTIRSGGKKLAVLNPLRVRNSPGVSSTVVAYISQGDSLTWTGAVKRIGNYDWFEVTFDDPVMGHIVGWVNSFYLTEDGKSLAGDSLKSMFNVQIDASAIGRLLQVTADWLYMRDGPTTKFPKLREIPWGRVVKLTGRYVDVDGSIWREAFYDGAVGWVAERYLDDYNTPTQLPAPEEGKVWVELKEKFSVSYYYVVDIDKYQPNSDDPERFSEPYMIQWRKLEHDLESVPVSYGALFGEGGVVMQGSGIIDINGERTWINIDNPTQLNWQDGEGSLVRWDSEASAWIRQADNEEVNANALEILNPEEARFAIGSIANEFIDFKSLAAPPGLEGVVAMPDLPGMPEGHDQIYEIDDRGGAFRFGDTRFDLFISDYEVAKEWYSDAYEGADAGRLSTPVFILQDLTPGPKE
jgi:hypothetical protein